MSKLLVVDDDRTVLHMIRQAMQETNVEVLTASSATEGLNLVREHGPDAVLLDIVLPDVSGLEAFAQYHALDNKLPIIFITGGGTSDTAIEAMKVGAYDYVLKPLDLPQVQALVSQAMRMRRMMNVPVGVDSGVVPEASQELIVGRSAPMQEVYKAIGRVAPQDVTVLIQGESGTGKELVARAIYHHSRREGKPFLAVNCAAIPEALLESELFGHEKGAFTGADRRRIGKFEQCSGGTIFLDEIGDMPAILQGKMLRLLQQQQFERLGGNETIQTDVRIIAATNRNLEEMVEEGEFREDLYYRLKVFLICLPELREREGDLLLLLNHLLARYNHELNKSVESISPDALELLRNYSWPGNVRELESVIKQAMLQATGPVIVPDFLPALREEDETDCEQMLSGAKANAGETSSAGDLTEYVDTRMQRGTENLYAETLEQMERYLLTRVLQATSGNQSQASRMLGITRGSLRNKIRALEISIDHVVSVSQDDPQ